jgi:uncharacterized protein YcgI (DUF1989 family)
LRDVTVPGGEGRAIEVKAGEYLSVVDVEGSQVADFVAVRLADVRRYVSPHQTRSSLRRITLRVGDMIVDNYREPVFEIVRDDVGVHDLLICACSPSMYRQRYQLDDHRSCRMNLLGALAPCGVEEHWLPDPINLFMDTPPRADGSFALRDSPSRPGDRFVLRALADVIVAVSACPFDLGPLNGGGITAIRLEVADVLPASTTEAPQA